MYCTKCGAQIDDNANRCIHCGEEFLKVEAPVVPPPPQPVPNYLVQSILVTLFCCLPLGIPAIVFSAQVNGKLQSGDLQGALAASKNAKTFCWIAFGLGLAATVVWVSLMVLGVVFGNR